MIIQNIGYHSLIEYLKDNLTIFEMRPLDDKHSTKLDLYVRYQFTEQIRLLFDQHPNLLEQEKLYIVDQFEHAYSDLAQIMGGDFKQQLTENQQTFIKDFSGLLKNLFDSQLLIT
ncbi:MAG: DUF3802 family protein [Psychrobium sp.]|nr:DUF3802 family protein [Psychrobium sp.]